MASRCASRSAVWASLTSPRLGLNRRWVVAIVSSAPEPALASTTASPTLSLSSSPGRWRLYSTSSEYSFLVTITVT